MPFCPSKAEVEKQSRPHGLACWAEVGVRPKPRLCTVKCLLMLPNWALSLPLTRKCLMAKREKEARTYCRSIVI